MGRSRVVLAVAVAALLAIAGIAALVARAGSSTARQVTITVSDGTKLACGLFLPAGNAPSGGWPGVVLFPGFGQTHAALEPLATDTLAPAGFASLVCDPRGTGASGGSFGLAGPTDVQDARDLFDWLAARSEVSNTAIGALGFSLGGGEVWNAAAAGVPFKAIVAGTAWTDLGDALAPDGMAKVGAAEKIEQLEPGTWEPSLRRTFDDLAHGTVTKDDAAALAARSARSRLHTLSVPTLILQGRHDFLFDADQARTAYLRLTGPKALYLGDLGNEPAASPAAEEPTYRARIVAWFERYLAGGKTAQTGVELAHDPWDGATTTFPGFPPTRSVYVNLPGETTLPAGRSASRTTRVTGGPLETLGDGAVWVRYSGASGSWSRLVATVAVAGEKTAVTEGAAPLAGSAGVVRIPLMDESVPLPFGKQLVVTIGAASPDGLFAAPRAAGGSDSIEIERVTLKLAVLDRAVSR